MTQQRHSRTVGLIGSAGLEKLKNAHVAVFGLGGVGSYAVEALARAGVGTLTVVDNDTVKESNINRQLIALYSTIGQSKTDAVAKRIADISPDASVIARNVFFDGETADTFDFSAFDYVFDAIDSVKSKLLLIKKCRSAGTPILSCMGTGNKLHPDLLQISDISKTEMCPLARVMRTELKKAGITSGVEVVFSKEVPQKSITDEETGAAVPASISFVPSVAGLLAAGTIINNIIKNN